MPRSRSLPAARLGALAYLRFPRRDTSALPRLIVPASPLPIVPPARRADRRLAPATRGQGTGAGERAAHLRLPAVRRDLERARRGFCDRPRPAAELSP